MLARGLKHSKRMAFGLAGTLLWAPVAFAAQTTVCPPSSTPIKLNFTTRMPDATYNNRLNITGLANLLRSQGATPDPQTRGLTLSQASLQVKGGATSMKRGNGFCAYLTSVTVDFGYDRMNVFIPSDFPQGSCQYNVVLDHENQHVAQNRAALREFSPRMRARVEAAMANAKPVFTSSQNNGADAAIDAIYGQLGGMLKEFEEIQRQRNAAIDSPANYKALSTMCKGWDGPGAVPK